MRIFDVPGGLVAIITDSHFGARADSPAFHEYFMRFYNDVFFPYLIREGIKIVLHLGDFTDRRKYINFVTLNRVRQYFMKRIQELGITLICTVGNHDTYYKNTNQINSMHELFSDIPGIIVLTEPEEVMFDKTKVLLVPWINEGNYDHSLNLIKTTSADYLMGHLELKGFLMSRGQRAETGLDATLFERFKFVGSGHYHHKSTENNVWFLGSPYEINFADLNDPRGFHIWKPGRKVNVEFIQNPYRMFYKVYYDDKKYPVDKLLSFISDKYQGTYVKVIVRSKMNPEWFDAFMDRLFSMQPADIKIEDDMTMEQDEDSVIDMAEDTLTILNKYVDTLEIDFDKKDPIKGEINILYQEALNVER